MEESLEDRLNRLAHEAVLFRDDTKKLISDFDDLEAGPKELKGGKFDELKEKSSLLEKRVLYHKAFLSEISGGVTKEHPLFPQYNEIVSNSKDSYESFFGWKKTLDGYAKLWGNVVLIGSTDRQSKIEMNKIAKKFMDSHDLPEKVFTLHGNSLEYDNGRPNVEIVDPRRRLSKEEIDFLIRHGDNYIVSKVENHKLANPIRKGVPSLMVGLCSEYYKLRTLYADQVDEFNSRFDSVTAQLVGIHLKEVVDEDTVKYQSSRLAKDIRETFLYHHDRIWSVLKEVNSNGPIDPDNPLLKEFRKGIQGFLNDYVNRKSQASSIMDLKSLCWHIGTEVIGTNDIGRLSCVVPWWDGRSDKIKTNPFETRQAKQDADDLVGYGVERIFTLNAHSKDQLEFYSKRGVDVVNLNMTNEFLSRIILSERLNQHEVVIISPDEGGLEDAMVFAREYHRRTGRKYKVRVIEMEKGRKTAGKVHKMSFKRGWLYDPLKGDKIPFTFNERGHPLPYDHEKAYAKEYKDPSSRYYIRNLYNTEFNEDQVEGLREKIEGSVGVIRDDIMATLTTAVLAMGFGKDKLGISSILAIEHASCVKQSKKLLREAYANGSLITAYASNSIFHEDLPECVIQLETSEPIYHHLRNFHMEWKKVNTPRHYSIIEEFGTLGHADDFLERN